MRLSPFKGSRSNMSSTEIFATTPKRILNAKTQSVDRYGFNNQSKTAEGKPVITFESLKPMAQSNLRAGSHTPSRMVRGRRVVPNSEQPSRLGRTPIKINGKDVNENLFDKFASKSGTRSCLKSSQPNSSETRSRTDPNDSDNDLTTSLNTIKNANSAKNVKAFLQSSGDPEVVQPRKKRRAVTFTSDLNSIAESPGKDDTQKMLRMILQNQTVIMNKLNDLEDRIR